MKNNKGVALVEMAIVLPLLIIIVFGIIEFGFIIYDKAMITNASREGARVGIVFWPDDGGPILPTDPRVQSRIQDTIQAYVGNYLISLGSRPEPPSFANGGITTVLEPSETGVFTPGGKLTVEVKYQYKFLILNPEFFKSALKPTIELSSTTVMRLE